MAVIILETDVSPHNRQMPTNILLFLNKSSLTTKEEEALRVRERMYSPAMFTLVNVTGKLVGE